MGLVSTSQNVRFVDAGLVTATALANGPVTLFAPGARDFVLLEGARVVTATDALHSITGICVGIESVLDQNLFITDDLAAGGQQSNDAIFVATIRSFVASFLTPGKTQLALPAVAWQANHAYNTVGVVVTGSGRWQAVNVPGTSGGSAPAWDTSGGVTADGAGTLVWQDCGAPISTGQIHVYLTVGSA